MSDHPKPLDCPKCESRMTPGGFSAHYGLAWVSSFRFWKLRPRTEVRSIIAYRCDNCGYIESYALPKGVPVAKVLPES